MTRPLGALLVDDEPPALRRLARLVEQVDGCQVLASCADADEVMSLCQRFAPDVIFLDIEMPGLDGLALARRLREQPQPPAVVFVTAFERYAVEAFDLEAVDYLVKPVRRERLERALARVRVERQERAAADAAIKLRLGDRLMLVPLTDVRVLQAEDKYVSVHHVGGVHLLEDSLVSLEQRFPDRLLRVHRSALVSPAHLRGLGKDSDGRDRLELADVPFRPEVSRRNLAQVRRLLHQMGKDQ
ncbi:MAG: response regulator transcription factor [Wenzhouxiangella sp.]|nr:response regulator transcription factor [Wenzhouxiangella sp.]MCH8477461.1 LytTR family DNA-binding domain-containing protein [Wenzhouxiangella sp.]TVR96946.1 MAG: DNA-binding response regulator [Wenzhouxiangellaceae bacterium]